MLPIPNLQLPVPIPGERERQALEDRIRGLRSRMKRAPAPDVEEELRGAQAELEAMGPRPAQTFLPDDDI